MGKFFRDELQEADGHEADREAAEDIVRRVVAEVDTGQPDNNNPEYGNPSPAFRQDEPSGERERGGYGLMAGGKAIEADFDGADVHVPM